MTTLIALLPTVEAMVAGLGAGVLLAVLLPTPKRRIAEAEAAGRAAAERFMAEQGLANGQAFLDQLERDVNNSR